jgi:RNA polymerase sigma-70 factor (ECF subfamily)
VLDRCEDSDRRPQSGGGLETTASLLARLRDGDDSARDRLLLRYLPILRRWAHGRLPARARDIADTDDLVQVTLLAALDHVKEFEPRQEGAFLAYLRRILINRIRDEIRSAGRRPQREPLGVDHVEESASPLERAIGREVLGAYEAALSKLPAEQQQAVILRIEMGFTHQQVAEALGLPSPNAARMMVARALVRVAEEMDGQGSRRASS